MFRKMFVLVLVWFISLSGVSAWYVDQNHYVNFRGVVSSNLSIDPSAVDLKQVGSGVVVLDYFNGELVFHKKSECDGNGAYFELPVEFDRNRGAIVVEADIYNYDSYSGCNEVSIILADDSGKGYATGYSAIDGQEMWVSYRPGMSSTDVHLGEISIDDLGNRWVHTTLIIYPSGHLKGIVYDYETGKSWNTVAYDDKVWRFSRMVILDGNDYRIKNVRVYYDFSEVSPYPVVESEFYYEVPNDTDFGQSYDSQYGWYDYASVVTLSDGEPAIYKHTQPDPRGGALVFPVTLDRFKYNIVIEADVMKTSTSKYNGLRFGLEDSNWDGYSFYADLGGGYLGYDLRDNGVATIYKVDKGFSYSANKWVHAKMILFSSGEIYTELIIDENKYTYRTTDATYNLFDRIVIRGGYPFYYRNMRVYAVKDDPLYVSLVDDVKGTVYLSDDMIRLGEVEVAMN